MPRKPTSNSIEAEKQLRALVAAFGRGDNKSLPTVRELGACFDISYASVARILQRLALEGVVWQHHSGRYFPASSRRRLAEGMSIVFIGRQMQRWSALYREILEGVSEVCTARGCPLVFLSCEKLVAHEDPGAAPTFLASGAQHKEMQRLLESVPRPSAGVLLDHLWEESVLTASRMTGRSFTVLVRPSDALPGYGGQVDFKVGIEMFLETVREAAFDEIHVAVPFAGDLAIDRLLQELEDALETSIWKGRHYRVSCETLELRLEYLARLRASPRRACIVSVEDNISSILHAELHEAGIKCPKRVGMFSMQGTGGVGDAITRLRYDYRKLGRTSAAGLLDGTMGKGPLKPSLIPGRTVL